MKMKTVRKSFVLLFPLMLLCLVLMPYRAKAESIEMENICIICPGETYGLWVHDWDRSTGKPNMKNLEIVSSKKKVVRYVKSGKNKYGQSCVFIKGKKNGTATIKLRNKKTHKVYATCKVIVAKYTRYYGGPKPSGSSVSKDYCYYTKARISENKITISGKLYVSKKHNKGKIKKIKNKQYRLTKKTLYGGYCEGIFGNYGIGDKKAAKRNLSPLGLGCEIYVANEDGSHVGANYIDCIDDIHFNNTVIKGSDIPIGPSYMHVGDIEFPNELTTANKSVVLMVIIAFVVFVALLFFIILKFVRSIHYKIRRRF